jgi:chromosome segregation ATPase
LITEPESNIRTNADGKTVNVRGFDFKAHRRCKQCFDWEDKKRSLKEKIHSLEQETAAIESKRTELAEQKAAHEKSLEDLRQQMIFA